MEQKKHSTDSEQKNEVFGLTHEQVEELRRNAIEKAQKQAKRWVQRGPYLICTTDDSEFAIHIGTQKMFIGVDDKGTPLFKQVSY